MLHCSADYFVYDDLMTFRSIVKMAAWLTAAFIVLATVCPIGLRPADFLPVDVDRALAFVILAALFTVSYPRHLWQVSAIVIALAGAAETLQLLTSTRHAHLEDASVKALGAAIGAMIGFTANRTGRVLYRARNPS